MAKIKSWLAGLIGLIILGLLILVAKLRNKSGVNLYSTYPYFLGKDLWFDRTAYPSPFYQNECKARLNAVFAVFDLFNNAGYDIKAIKSIIIWETGWLSSSGSRHAVSDLNNIVGMTPSGVLKQYTDIYACLIDLDRLFNLMRYSSAYAVRGSGQSFIQELYLDGYNDTIEWRNGVLGIYSQI